MLLRSGRSIVNRLILASTISLARRAARSVDGDKDIGMADACWAVRFPSKQIGHAATRPLMDVDDPAAAGAAPEGSHYRRAGRRGSHRERRSPPRPWRQDAPAARRNRPTRIEPAADLTVDATGRGSRASQWLHQLGYPEPPRTEIDAFLGYASRLIRLPANSSRSWQGLCIQPKLPTELRTGGLFRVENGDWTAPWAATPGTTPRPMSKIISLSLAPSAPDLDEAIKDAEPLTR